MRPVYLDNNATTRVDPEVVQAMLPFFTEQFGNPSSSHDFGASAGAAVRKARLQVQTLIGAEFDDEITFTSGGTESDNAAILSALEVLPERTEIVTSAVEHSAVLTLCAHLEKTRGIKVHRIPVDRHGRLDLDTYKAALTPRVAIVSIMSANNETGTIFPVVELAELAKDVGALFHTDAVQAVGKLAIDLKSTAIDMLSLSGHKLHGPKGVGALYVKRGVRFCPLIKGGRQEGNRRAGTQNTPGIVGLGVAADLALKFMDDANTRVRALRDRLEKELLQRIPDAFVAGDLRARLSNTANIAFGHIEGDGILHFLNREGIACSSGSACASGSLEPNHVLVAMNIPDSAAHGAIRFSFSRNNGEEDVDRVLEVMPGIVKKLRDLSPSSPATAQPRPPFPAKENAMRSCFAKSRAIDVTDILARLMSLSAAEEFFAVLGISYDPKVLNVSRLHIMKRMGQYLAEEDFAGLPDGEIAARARATLERAYEDFATSSPLTQRVFKVLKEHDPDKPATRDRAFVPFDSILRRFETE
ncbi:cysteine desulfurase NifS [Mesorhizobium japonicum]|nr:cysteine desulfurase NifS [Mesorhizobium japonicum]